MFIPLDVTACDFNKNISNVTMENVIRMSCEMYNRRCLSKYVLCVCCGVLRYCYCLYTTLQS